MSGIHICFCGLDGIGKTTQAQRLERYLNDIGIKSKIVHGFKPGINSSTLKEYARKHGDNFTENYTPNIRSISYIIDIYDKYYNNILPLLLDGYVVISDKYILESLINAPLMGADEKLIVDISKIIPAPDLYIYLKATADVAHNRQELRNCEEIYTIKNTYKFMEKSSQRYKGILAEHKYIEINANNCIDKVFYDIVCALRKMKYIKSECTDEKY